MNLILATHHNFTAFGAVQQRYFRFPKCNRISPRMLQSRWPECLGFATIVLLLLCPCILFFQLQNMYTDTGSLFFYEVYIPEVHQGPCAVPASCRNLSTLMKLKVEGRWTTLFVHSIVISTVVFVCIKIPGFLFCPSLAESTMPYFLQPFISLVVWKFKREHNQERPFWVSWEATENPQPLPFLWHTWRISESYKQQLAAIWWWWADSVFESPPAWEGHITVQAHSAVPSLHPTEVCQHGDGMLVAVTVFWWWQSNLVSAP